VKKGKKRTAVPKIWTTVPKFAFSGVVQMLELFERKQLYLKKTVSLLSEISNKNVVKRFEI